MANRNPKGQKSPRNRYPKIRKLWTAMMTANPIHRCPQEGTTPSPRLSHSWVVIALFFYLIPLLLFHTVAVFGTDWDIAYYVWQKASDVLFIVAIRQLVPHLRTIIVPILLYSTLRLCLQIAGIFKETDQNTQYIITVLYLAALAATLFLTIKYLEKEWKEL